MRIVLIANTRSGGTTDAEAIARALGAHGSAVAALDVADAERAAQPRAWPDGGDEGLPDRVVVAGGDGSIGLAARAAGAAGIPLAVIPTGTANDFARAFDLPTDPDAAARLAADPAARTTPIELAHAAERPFVNAASCGLSVLAATRAAPLKPRLGPLAYAVGALRAGLTGTPLQARVTADGATVHDGPAWQVIVGATGAFGGGSGLGPAAADSSDGLLDVAVLAATSRPTLARRAYGLRFGSVTEQDGVHHARGARIEVRLPPGTSWNVDGELCTLEPAEFGAERAAVEVVVP